MNEKREVLISALLVPGKETWFGPCETALWEDAAFAHSGLPTIVHLLFTVHEVSTDAGRVFLGSQGSFDALNEVAEVV